METKQDAVVMKQDARIRTVVYDDAEVCPEGLQPFLYTTKNGTVLLQYQMPQPGFNQRPQNYGCATCTQISRDDGRHFEKYIFEEGKDDPFLEAGAVELADGRFFFMDTYVTADPSEPKEHAVGETWWSTDDLKTLTGPGQNHLFLPGIDFYGSADDDGNLPQTGHSRLHRTTLQLPDGEILMLMYGHFMEDKAPASYEPKMMKTRVWIVSSKDNGKTFATKSVVAKDDGIGTEGFGEPVMVRVGKGKHEGRLICVMRTGRDLYEAHSDDNGESWSYFERLTFDGIDIYDINKWRARFDGKYDHIDVHRRSLSGAVVDPDLTQMKNGLLVLSFGVRIPAQLGWEDPIEENNGVFCAFSADGGDTWSHIVRVMGGKLTTQYTAVREAQNGDLLFAYDVGSWRQGGRGGRLCRIAVDYQN